MLLLALDTATPACSVALVEVTGASDADGEVDGEATEAVRATGGAERRVVDPRRHAELLVPLVREVLDEAAARPADLDGVVVGTGPGPFTSLRVGVVTAGAFANALGIPVYGICSLDGIGADTSGRTAVATDARRREVYWAVYTDGRRVAGPAVGRPRDVADELLAMSVERVAGVGSGLYPEAFADLDHGGEEYPSPITLARLAGPDALARRPPSSLVPLYLRRPDAAEPHAPKTVTV